MPDRKWPYPKALYAAEDTPRFFVASKTDAVILDVFAGSGTTTHAVMRSNRQDGGERQCISVTNNEVGADEQKGLREQGLRPGDDDWERVRICKYITKPRREALITGSATTGKPVECAYKCSDKCSMADGLEENAEFVTLTYETPGGVNYQTAFAGVGPLLWMRAECAGNASTSSLQRDGRLPTPTAC